MKKRPKRPLESSIEGYFKRRCKELRIFCMKNTGMNGIPDRTVFKDGIFMFVELKRPGEKPSDLQRAIIRKLKRKGALVRVADTKEAVDKALSIFETPDTPYLKRRLTKFYKALSMKIKRRLDSIGERSDQE